MAEIKSMEHATLKVPYELLNKKFRIAQKTIDREVDQVLNASREVEYLLKSGTPTTVSEVRKLVAGVCDRINILKRKATDPFVEELNASLVCKRKLDHLMENVHAERRNSYEVKPASEDPWKRTRMDRMVIEHLILKGYYKTAERLADRVYIRDLTNIEIFQTSREVEEDLAKHKTMKCISWCNDNKSKLRKINSSIEFQARVQEFVELIRNNKRVDAVKHARKYFAAFEKTQINEICRCMALLAYPVNVAMEPYKELFDVKRWDQLILNFRNENYRLFQLSNQSLLSVAIQVGLSALKTPQCYTPHCKNLNCPVCQEDFNTIAKKLPYSHCVQSRLICRITGLQLNEHNLPMMLPNGQIFGQLGLPQITKENGSIVCPITKTKFTNPKIDKVFVM